MDAYPQADLRLGAAAFALPLLAAGLGLLRPSAFAAPPSDRLFFSASNRLTTLDGLGAACGFGAFLPAFLARISSSSASSYLSSNFDGSNFAFFLSMMSSARSVISWSVFTALMSPKTVSGCRTVLS